MTWTIDKQKIKSIKQQVSASRLKKVKRFVVFVGHAHSGHSLIGALLDSHPQVTIANEANVAKLVRDHRFGAMELMSVLIHGAESNADDDGWFNTGYSYKIAGSEQGRAQCPLVIGDKKGGGNARVIRKTPSVLEDLSTLFGDKLLFVQVVRNPYDNIAALAHYWKEPLQIKHVVRYFENMETCDWIKKSGAGEFYRVMFSDFISDPVGKYTNLLQKLSVNINRSELISNLSIVKEGENRRSLSYKWSKNIKREVQNRMKRFDFLDRFENVPRL